VKHAESLREYSKTMFRIPRAVSKLHSSVGVKPQLRSFSTLNVISSPTKYAQFKIDAKKIDLAAIRAKFPLTTGDIVFYDTTIQDWRSCNVISGSVEVASRLVFVALGEGMDLGSGYSVFAVADNVPVLGDTYSSMSSASGKPPITQGAVDYVNTLDKSVLDVPSSLWYRVKATNPRNGQSAYYHSLVNTGSSRTGLPNAYYRLGIEACGEEHTSHHDGKSDVRAGPAIAELVSSAVPDGIDEDGVTKWKYTPLSESMKLHLAGTTKPIIAKLEGYPVIGLNSLLYWNLCVHPRNGLFCPPKK